MNAADISAVKVTPNKLADSYTYRFDLDADGTVTETELSAVKARSGWVIPYIDYRC